MVKALEEIDFGEWTEKERQKGCEELGVGLDYASMSDQELEASLTALSAEVASRGTAVSTGPYTSVEFAGHTIFTLQSP